MEKQLQRLLKSKLLVMKKLSPNTLVPTSKAPLVLMLKFNGYLQISMMAIQELLLCTS